METLQTVMVDYWDKRSASYTDVIKKNLADGWENIWAYELIKHFPQGGDLSVLDVGVGPGFYSIILAKHGFRVTAIDFSAGMLSEAKNNAGSLSDKISFLQMDAQSLLFPDNCFDVIVTRNLTWNLPEPVKAYSSRVGAGSFVTELFDETGDRIRDLGHEYGTVTKRPRRCGWLDLVAVKYAIDINGVNYINLNHLDTIGCFDKIKICVGYDINGVVTEDFSTNEKFLNCAKPVYKEFEGNFGDVSKCKTYEELPEAAKKYISFIEEYTGTFVKLIGVGADRENMIVREV